MCVHDGPQGHDRLHTLAGQCKRQGADAALANERAASVVHKTHVEVDRSVGGVAIQVYVRARPCADGQKPPEDMFERNRDTQKNIVIKVSVCTQDGDSAAARIASTEGC